MVQNADASGPNRKASYKDLKEEIRREHQQEMQELRKTVLEAIERNPNHATIARLAPAGLPGPRQPNGLLDMAFIAANPGYSYPDTSALKHTYESYGPQF